MRRTINQHWLTVSGASGAIVAQGGAVRGVVREAVGVYLITWAVAIADAETALEVTPRDARPMACVVEAVSPTQTRVRTFVRPA